MPRIYPKEKSPETVKVPRPFSYIFSGIFFHITVHSFRRKKSKISKLSDQKESYNITNKHDKIFRTILDKKEEAIALINQAIKTKLKSEEIEKYTSSFVSKIFQNREADTVYKYKNKNIFFTDHWSKHRKTAGSLSFLGGTAYNAGIAQRCARLRRRSIKTFVHFLELTALPQ